MINLVIQADVVNITNDKPSPDDRFWVDTNILFWQSYSKASLSSGYQRAYGRYIGKAANANATMYRTALSLAELANVIERMEHDFYQARHGRIDKKEFRHNLTHERSRVVSEILLAWAQVETMTSHADCLLDSEMTQELLSLLGTTCSDGTDLLIVSESIRQGVQQVISDDGDLATIPGICLFTANQTVLNAAIAQGRLTVRQPGSFA